MFGGEGDDFIRGGDGQVPFDRAGLRTLQYINGGEGDDRLLPGDFNGDMTIRGGKGNDKINVYEGSDLFDSYGKVVFEVYEERIGNSSQGITLFDGGEGDD